jgi:hypothetical protein
VPTVTIVRDLLLVTAAATLWIVDGAGSSSAAHGLLTGVMTALMGFLAHEWSHLAGAKLTRSQVHFPNKVFAPLLFHFDTARNTRKQFLAMSYGGYAGTAIATVLIVALVPFDRIAGQTAIALAAIGGIVTLIAEVPTTFRVIRGAPLPSGYAFTMPDGGAHATQISRSTKD